MKKGKRGIILAVLCIVLAIGIEISIMSRAKINSSNKDNSKEAKEVSDKQISNEEKIDEEPITEVYEITEETGQVHDSAGVVEVDEVQNVQELEDSFDAELKEIDNAEALVWAARSWEDGTTITYLGQQNIEGKDYYVFRPYNPNSQNSKSAIVEIETKRIYLYNPDHGSMTEL